MAEIRAAHPARSGSGGPARRREPRRLGPTPRGFLAALRRRPDAAILGVLNATPDSFSDGGRLGTAAEAVAHGRRLLADGASAVDVGGESTRPGAAAVPVEEELRRVLPVVRALARLGVVSIDTTKAAVAAEALAAGASVVNDVSGGEADRDMLPVVADAGADVVLMHRRGTPATMQRLARYRDVVADVRDHLARRVDAALAAGIRESRIAVDPGIGFAKTMRHNLLLLREIGTLVALGFPVVVGVSRKAFLGRILDAPPAGRLEGTIAASLAAVAGGAKLVRVHDVAPMARALRVAEAIRSARP